MEEQTLQTEGLTFEKVWAMFQETDRKFQENEQQAKENERQRQADWAALKEQFKETDRKISKLGSRIGDLIEHFLAGNILAKFKELGFEFDKVSQNLKIKEAGRRTIAEVDIYLEDGDTIMMVEVKTNLSHDDVKEHIERMDAIRARANEHGDTRKYLGAIAAAIAGEKVKEFALKCGFYVVEQEGDNVRIAAPENVRVWQ